MNAIRNITISPEILKFIAEIDEFKGRWTVIETLAPEKHAPMESRSIRHDLLKTLLKVPKSGSGHKRSTRINRQQMAGM